MAFCRNCGSEIPVGVNFCENCGTKVEIQDAGVRRKVVNTVNNPVDDYDYDFDDMNNYANPESYSSRARKSAVKEEPVSVIDKFGKFYGIILMILAFIDFQSDPAFLTIVLSAAIIAGCIFCFSKKYKLKGFTIIAMIIAIICLICGIGQAKKIGLFKVPGKEKVAEDIIEVAPIVEDKAEEKTIEEKPAEIKGENKEEIKEEADTAEPQNEKKESINGVDPDLKEFLDSYEAFMDEYVAFMKKYQADPGNAISMMSDYMTILTKYEDFANKANAYNQDEMSKEDLAYYLDAMTRIEKKMLDVL